MRSPDTLLTDVNALADEYAALLGGVQEDNYIDQEEAVLGKEYAEKYRASLQALKRETNDSIKEVRANYRERIREVRAEASSAGRASQRGNRLREEQVDALHPYYEVLLRLDKLLAEARLSKAAFAAASDKLKETGADAVLIPQLVNISADEDEEQPTAQSLASSDTTDLADLVREAAGRWQMLLSEANDRLTLHAHPKQDSHLRGIKKALELALDDLSALLVVDGDETG